MKYLEIKPHPELQRYVRCYILVEELHNELTQEHRFLPEQSPKLCFYHGQSFVGGMKDELSNLPNGYFTSLKTIPLRAVSLGLTRALQVDFYPWGAVHLLGLRRGLQDADYGLEELGIQKLARAVKGWLSLRDFGNAVNEIETWLLGRSLGVGLETTSAIEAAVQLYSTKGQAPIGSIAEEIGISLRQLQRSFQKDLGIAPKALAKLIRFEEAYNLIRLEPTRSLTELAFDLGFADQAHFTREFSGLAQMNPSQFAHISQARKLIWQGETLEWSPRLEAA